MEDAVGYCRAPRCLFSLHSGSVGEDAQLVSMHFYHADEFIIEESDAHPKRKRPMQQNDQQTKAVLFDHDGLLVETEILFYEVTRELLAREGVVLTQELWGDDYLSKGRSSSSIALDLGFPAHKLQSFVEERNARYHATLEQEPPLCPFVREVLAGLKTRYRLGLVTGNSRRAIETVHRSTGVLGFFDLIVTQEDFTRAKPWPDAYQCACSRLALSPDRCIAVEDSGRGLAAALSAGVPCVMVPGVLTRGQDFKGSSAVLSSLQELPSLIEKLKS